MSARLFVALDLPEDAVEALVAWRAPLLRGRDELRAVAPGALHATVYFLGARPEEAIAPIAEIVERCAAEAGGAPALALGAPLWLPRRRPRVLAVALEDRQGRLVVLQKHVAEGLAVGGWHDPEARPYLPHVTIARVRGREAAAHREAEPPGPPPLAFDGAALTLYRSRPHPAGARYEPLSVSRLA